MMSTNGKFYQTDVADTAQILRLIQSIPSPKAEPFKQWLAQVGKPVLWLLVLQFLTHRKSGKYFVMNRLLADSDQFGWITILCENLI